MEYCSKQRTSYNVRPLLCSPKVNNNNNTFN